MANLKASRWSWELVVVTRPLLEEELSFEIIQERRGIWGCDEDKIAGAMHRSIEGIAGAATVASLQAFAGFADSEYLAVGISLNVEAGDYLESCPGCGKTLEPAPRQQD